MQPTSSAFLRSVSRRTVLLLWLLGFATAPADALPISSISSNFNGTNISSTSFVWFNSHLTSVTGGTGQRIIYFRNQTISFQSPQTSTIYTLNVPDAQVLIDSSLGGASTTFNTGTNTWQTSVQNSSNDPFLAGLSWDVPAGENPKSANPVTWQGEFFANQTGISVQWQWAAAVYTTFSTSHNTLGVTPIDGFGGYSQSGTPSAFTSYVTGGARGGGGSNYTGSNSGTGSASNLSLIPEPSSAALLAASVSALALRRWRSRRRERDS